MCDKNCHCENCTCESEENKYTSDKEFYEAIKKDVVKNGKKALAALVEDLVLSKHVMMLHGTTEEDINAVVNSLIDKEEKLYEGLTNEELRVFTTEKMLKSMGINLDVKSVYES